MNMLLNNHRLITERHQRAWSQTQLAEISGLSLRTIQRIEKNGNASLESVKSLASVYNLKITDLRIVKFDEVNLPENNQPVMVNFCLLSLTAKILTTTVFILSTLVFLFMLWTNIPPVAWINELRDVIFSDQLSVYTLKIISSILTMISTLALAIFVGILFDAFRNEGFYHSMKCLILSGRLSLSRYSANIQLSILKYGKFLAKPLIISSLIILVAGAGVYLSMEDYQKKNMASFLQNFLSDHKPEIS